MIVLVVLGIIAAIATPSILNNSSKKQNITKLRKAITAYDQVVQNMRATEGLVSIGNEDGSETGITTLNGFASSDSCANGKKYFKIVSEDGCKFKSTDGMWWDISVMSKPIVAFKEENLTAEKAKDKNTYDAFYLRTIFSREKGNAFIVNDPSGYAGKALYYAKLIDELPSEFTTCQSEREATCKYTASNGKTYTYTKTTLYATDVSMPYGCYQKDGTWTRKACTSSVETGEYYLANEGTASSIISKEKATSDEICNESRWTECKTKGDYWLVAKKYCEEQGSHMASLAELKAAGYDQVFGYYMSSDEYADRDMWEMYRTGSVGFTDKAQSGRTVICVAN